MSNEFISRKLRCRICKVDTAAKSEPLALGDNTGGFTLKEQTRSRPGAARRRHQATKKNVRTKGRGGRGRGAGSGTARRAAERRAIQGGRFVRCHEMDAEGAGRAAPADFLKPSRTRRALARKKIFYRPNSPRTSKNTLLSN